MSYWTVTERHRKSHKARNVYAFESEEKAVNFVAMQDRVDNCESAPWPWEYKIEEFPGVIGRWYPRARV